jgi:hypothetical protein
MGSLEILLLASAMKKKMPTKAPRASPHAKNMNSDSKMAARGRKQKATLL